MAAAPRPRWYTWREVEHLAEDLLRRAGAWSEEPAATDIESLLELHLGVRVDYAADTDPDVLGYTEFRATPEVKVAQWLTEAASGPGASPGIVGRWRATLAHEAGHIVLHAGARTRPRAWAKLTGAMLEDFDPGEAAALRTIEYQANMMMVALLMPERRVVRCLLGMTDGREVFPPLAGEDGVALELELGLARTFSVSREMARIRMAALGMREPEDGAR